MLGFLTVKFHLTETNSFSVQPHLSSQSGNLFSRVYNADFIYQLNQSNYDVTLTKMHVYRSHSLEVNNSGVFCLPCFANNFEDPSPTQLLSISN